ncbi:MAG: response regulator [Bacteroidales bacterium]
MMKKTVNVLIVEDNEYYNNLLTATLKQCIRLKSEKWDFRIQFHSFTDSCECLGKIRSFDFGENDSIAFIDYYLGEGINGTHLIKVIKDQRLNTTVVLMSQSRDVKKKVDPGWYDYFVEKDKSAPALCCLYLEQYLENKFYIPLV